MGVLKGIMTLCVFIFAAVFLCKFQDEQCISSMKVLSCTLIVMGSFVYYGLGTKCQNDRFSRSAFDSMGKNDIPVGDMVVHPDKKIGMDEAQALVDNFY